MHQGKGAWHQRSSVQASERRTGVRQDADWLSEAGKMAAQQTENERGTQTGRNGGLQTACQN